MLVGFQQRGSGDDGKAVQGGVAVARALQQPVIAEIHPPQRRRHRRHVGGRHVAEPIAQHQLDPRRLVEELFLVQEPGRVPAGGQERRPRPVRAQPADDEPGGRVESGRLLGSIP